MNCYGKTSTSFPVETFEVQLNGNQVKSIWKLYLIKSKDMSGENVENKSLTHKVDHKIFNIHMK